MNSEIINIHNPIPILQQQSSNILDDKNNDNPNISNERKRIEKMIYEKLIQEDHKQKIKQKDKSLNQKIADSFVGVLSDIFTKENNISWITHIKIIFNRDARYFYLGILFLTIGLILIIFQRIKI